MEWKDWPILREGDFWLEPLCVEHADELRATCDAETFRYFLSIQPASLEPDAFRNFVRRLAEGATHQAYLMRDGSRAVGCSSFMDLRPEHRGLEIGMTWIAPASRGTRVNPSAKLLMLRHAFEGLSCTRVQLKCDARNVVSQAAIAKLGALREGVLRRHMVMPDGYVRDTVMFSITEQEWPDVRARLQARIAGF